MVRLIFVGVYLFGWVSALQASTCDRVLLGLGFTAESFAACAVDAGTVRQVFLALDADPVGLTRLESASAALRTATVDLEDARQSLAVADESQIQERRAAFSAAQGMHDTASAAFEEARSLLRLTIYSQLNASQQAALDRSRRSAVMFLPVQYRQLQWSDERLGELGRALAAAEYPSQQVASHLAIIADARTSQCVHDAEAWLAFHLEDVRVEFASRSCN